MDVVQGHQSKGNTMRQTGTSAAAGSAGMGALAKAGLIAPGNEVSRAQRRNLQAAVSRKDAIATSGFLSRGLRRNLAAFNKEHPLMGPHPTD